MDIKDINDNSYRTIKETEYQELLIKIKEPYCKFGINYVNADHRYGRWIDFSVYTNDELQQKLVDEVRDMQHECSKNDKQIRALQDENIELRSYKDKYEELTSKKWWQLWK